VDWESDRGETRYLGGAGRVCGDYGNGFADDGCAGVLFAGGCGRASAGWGTGVEPFPIREFDSAGSGSGIFRFLQYVG